MGGMRMVHGSIYLLWATLAAFDPAARESAREYAERHGIDWRKFDAPMWKRR